MRHACPGLQRPFEGLALPLALLLVTGLVACAEQQPTSSLARQPAAPHPPVVDTTTALPFVVDTGATPGGWLAVDHTSTPLNSAIYLVSPDGAQTVQLTHDHFDAVPAWSPDGSWIAFARKRDITPGDYSPLWQIWVIRRDGTDERRLSLDGYSPSWLGDGRVVYQCPGGLCSVGVDATNADTLAANVDREVFRVISPDGNRMAFARDTITNVWEEPWLLLYVANRNGSSAHRLTTTPAGTTEELYPHWSRDGTRILFLSVHFGFAVADADGGSEHSVSRGLTTLGTPAWSADGARVVFGASATEFFIANADGTGTIRRVHTTLVQSPEVAQGNYPSTWSWSPR